MRLLAVDDEKLALQDLVGAIREAEPEASVHDFRTPKDALAFAEQNPIDVAFLDIEMPGMNGLALAKRLKEINKNTNIVFVTGYSQYAVDSYAVQASGYIMKPVTKEAIKSAIEHLRRPVKAIDTGLRVQCFGNFEVFSGGIPIHFPRSKSKELFAYLIHKKGATCTIKELAAELFENEENSSSQKSHVRHIVSTAIKALDEAGVKGVIIKKFNSLSVDISKVNCDYYGFLKWQADSVNLYTGEYMSNYSWAEFTLSFLNDKIK